MKTSLLTGKPTFTFFKINPKTFGKGKGKEKEKDKDRRQPKGPRPFDQAERDEMESILHELRGHLGLSLRIVSTCYAKYYDVTVLYPTRFLEGEDVSNNFLFPSDRYVVCQLGVRPVLLIILRVACCHCRSTTEQCH